MNIRGNLLGSAMSFAHLASIGSGKKAKGKTKVRAQDEDKPDAEDDENDKPASGKSGKKAKGRADDDDKPDAEDDDDKPEAEDDDDKPDAEEDDDDTSAEEGDDEGEDDEPPRSRKAQGKKAATAEYRRGVKAERARCAAIFGSKAAGRNIPLAASLAFDTGMSATAAINVLKAQPAVSSASDERARRNPDLGADPGAPNGSASVNKSWGASINRAVPGASNESSGWGGAIQRVQR